MKYLTILLAFLLCQQSFALNRIPDSRSATQVSPEQLQSILQSGYVKKVRQVALAQSESADSQVVKIKKEEEDKDDENPDVGYSSGDFFADLSLHTYDGRELIIVFAVLGAVLTVVWIASVPYSAYLALSGKEEYEYLQMLSLEYSGVLSKKLRGEQTHLNYNLFFKEEDESVHTGFAAESGYYEFERLNGYYWLLGPSLLIPIDPFHVKINLLGGSSFTEDIGLFAKGDVGLLYDLNKNLLLGVHTAIQYLDIKNNKGFADSGAPDMLLGGSITYRF